MLERRRFRLLFAPDPLREMKTADALFCRDGSGFVRDVIEISGNGPYHHVARFFWDGRDPCVVEMHEKFGGRRVSWYDWLRERDDTVEVLRPDLYHVRGYDPQGAVDWMRKEIVGKPYGTDTIKRFGKQRNWITGWFNRANSNEDAPPPTDWVCSTGIAGSDKYGGGVHPVTRLWVGDVQPSALARCKLYDYVFTVPSKLERTRHQLQGANV